MPGNDEYSEITRIIAEQEAWNPDCEPVDIPAPQHLNALALLAAEKREAERDEVRRKLLNLLWAEEQG